MTPEERAARGVRFRELLDGDLGEALDAIERDITAELLNNSDRDQRDNLWIAARQVRKLREYFVQAATDGRVATHTLAEVSRIARIR
jgi:hypothetical protein